MDQPSQSGIDVWDAGVRREQNTHYQGTVRVSLQHLVFDPDLLGRPKQQFLQSKNVERLRHIFATEGCHRLEPAHRIAALISRQELQILGEHSNLSQSALHSNAKSDLPMLTMPVGMRLRVLHGQHRLEAARRFLPSKDAWWAVDLYLDGKAWVQECLHRAKFL